MSTNLFYRMWRILFWLQQWKNSLNGLFSVKKNRRIFFFFKKKETSKEKSSRAFKAFLDQGAWWWMSCGERVHGGRQRWGGQTTRRFQIPFAIINVWNRPACRYLPLHPIAAPPRPVGFIVSPYIQTAVRVLIKEGRKPPLVNRKQMFWFAFIHNSCPQRENCMCYPRVVFNQAPVW